MTDVHDLAEAYVLSLLDPEEQRRVEARVLAPTDAADAELRGEVAAAAARLHELDLTATPEPVSEGAFVRLASRLRREAEVERDPDATRARPAAPLSMRGAARQMSDAVWRPVALGAFAAIAASLVVIGVLGWQLWVAPVPTVVAILLDADGQTVAIVEAYDDDAVQITPLAPLSAGGSNVLQVWTKPDDAGPPVSIGILPSGRRTRLDGPELPAPRPEQLFEITVEPPGGSPTGLPTGVILGKGLAQPTF